MAKPHFGLGERVLCLLPLGAREGVVVEPTGRFGYPVDRRKVIAVRYDDGSFDCVQLRDVRPVRRVGHAPK